MSTSTLETTEYTNAYIPYGFHLVMNKEVQLNDSTVKLMRFQKEGSNVNYNGGNASLLVSETGRLEGLSRLLPEYEFKDNNIQKEEARYVAMSFLKHNAGDLLENFKVKWIDRHDEFIYENGRKIIISGMKVKCRNLTDGLYFWVIVSPNKDVIVFERDIEWDFIHAGRQTQKWLHDSWLKNNI